MKYALVTGTDHGLGYELALKLVTQGYMVFAGCYSDSLESLKDIKKHYEDRLDFLHLDIADWVNVRKVKEYISNKTNQLDLLINNAGILGDIKNTIEDELDFDDIERVIHVNAIGTLKVTNAMYPLLLQGQDKLIVNISSEAGSIGDCGRDAWFGYCMSKSAINMESALIQNKFKHHQGQVMVVHPGWLKTYMQGKLDEKAELTPAYSADCIYKLIEDRETYRNDQAVYLDYQGNQLNW